jgi:signal transduction histidine kinase
VGAELQQREPHRVVEVRIEAPAVVHGDPKLLRSLLENLIGNAWKFTSGAERAHIEFGTDTVDGEPAYFVRDDGPGFDMSFAAKLFEPFQRAHGVDEYPGTGIGLATVKRIVERHGGRVWVESAEGRGTTFYFTIGEAEQT